MEKSISYSAEEIISSINGIQRAEPGYFLFTRIEQHIKNAAAETLPAGLKKMLVPIYASLLFFITINLLSYVHFNQKQQSGPQVKQNPAEAFAREYGLETSVY